jgi:hypothetical protein
MKFILLTILFTLLIPHYGICSENKIEFKYKTNHHPADQHLISNKTYQAKLNSIIVLNDGEQMLEIGPCDFGSSFYCEIFIQSTYDTQSFGFDGIVEENQYIIPLVSRNHDGDKDNDQLILSSYFSKKFPNLNNETLPKIKLPNYNDNVVGLLDASAGASGLGFRTLTLINLDTGQYTQVWNSTFNTIKWYETNEGWGYIHTDNFYSNGFGGIILYKLRVFLGLNKNVFKFDEKTFSFLKQKAWYNFPKNIYDYLSSN